MRKMAVLLLLLFCGVNAFAEWTLAYKDTGSTIFLDKSTVRKSGGIIRIWQLSELPKPSVISGKVTYLSTVAEHYYDCMNYKHKLGRTVSYSGSMGQGVEVSRFPEDNIWWDVTPQGIMGSMFKIVCSM